MNGPAERTGEGEALNGRVGPLTALLVALLVLVGASSCALLESDDPSGAKPTSSATAAPREVVSSIRRTLALRQSGVRRQDRGRFERSLLPGRPALQVQQSDYFDNLTQLPLEVFEYDFDPRDLLRVEDSYWVVVEVHLQLAGYDSVPVVARDRYLFEPGGGPKSRLRLASVTDEAWEARNRVVSQPWDSGAIQVRQAAGVLGIFDDASAGAAYGLLDSAQRAISDVSAVVPFDWSHQVVLYALSGAGGFASVGDLPGGDPTALDAVAVPVAADPRDPGAGVASTRVVLNPRIVETADAPRTDPEGRKRDRLVRHEVAHVAVGELDDDAPVWLAEGLAEWVSVRPLAPEDRALPEAALAAARAALAAGRVAMPSDEAFNADGSTGHYGLSWWAVEYLANSFGEQVLWTLVEGASDEPALERLVGLDEDRLAMRAARLMVATYD
ncbi:hypothetical protein I601_3542 [Nocardioides dokdonensis FR1436]|uniref:Peptidase MA-like domain-containing protein n=1 Tax=Nocardioides dokdonensis FR1436 TaxID=1300347 RepID=A0A1A9GNS9_9ACTN|nr:hypothetical protein [Nocardioides dokdonensis]ANH39948.1 hypothetical protein I601_3542 [Nocardioides dokdonensis FR1436]